MDGLTPLEDVERELADMDRKANADLSLRRTMQRIDRALDCRNQREFLHLSELYRHYKRQRG
jgi:hypothetical protein